MDVAGDALSRPHVENIVATLRALGAVRNFPYAARCDKILAEKVLDLDSVRRGISERKHVNPPSCTGYFPVHGRLSWGEVASGF